jgi:exodeoxyribonuclease VII large subunit
MPEELDLARFSRGGAPDILSVSELNRSVRDLLEHRFPLLWVRGEISNYTLAKSGHAYFVLKDAQAQIRCAMFRNRNQLLNWQPRDGVQVEVQALVTLYEARGEFQLVAQTMRHAGRGALYEAYLKLKAKLESEGLFDPAAKRPLPTLPRRIGIVTSPQAAALRDVLTTLARRNPSAEIVIYPSQVQGAGAAATLAGAIATAGKRAECDVLILCRGGGGIEDLWCFNDEGLARAIRACPIPVISGVGHETDFTIADFAADARAPTPTAAAEMASPVRAELLDAVAALLEALRSRLERHLDIRAQTVDHLTRRLRHPGQQLRERAAQLAQLETRARRATASTIQQHRLALRALLRRLTVWRLPVKELEARMRLELERLDAALHAQQASAAARLESLCTALEHLAPQRVMERGYSIARDAKGQVVRDSTSLSAGDAIELSFARGGAHARIEETRE